MDEQSLNERVPSQVCHQIVGLILGEREREGRREGGRETERERDDVCDIVPYSSLSPMDSPHCMCTCVLLCCHSILRKSRNKEIFR